MLKKIVSGLLAVMLLVMTWLPAEVNATEDWGVTVSNVDYQVELADTPFVFICNKDTVGSKVGTEYYMLYTVESMKMEATEHQGIMGTNNPMQEVPFATSGEYGGYYYNVTNKNQMLMEGKTYLLKFVITEDGFDYQVAWAQDEESQYFQFFSTWGEVKTDLGYFGLFIAGTNMNGKLTKIRCYDKNGKDLGIQVTQGKNATISKKLFADTQVKHNYKITLEGAHNVVLSNRKKPTSDKVYIEYTVASSDSMVSQSGLFRGNKNEAYSFDEISSRLYYKQEAEGTKNGMLLEPGAKYIIEMEKTVDGMYVIVQKTKDGQTTYLSFPLSLGKCPDKSAIYGLFFGIGDANTINCVLKDFKFYDSNKNNLGVVLNQKSRPVNWEIIHYGVREDYSGCEAIYFCDEDQSLYALYADKTLKYTADGQTYNGTYKIDEITSKMAVTIDGKTEEWDYLYQRFTNAEGKRYRRLHVYTVTFDTGSGEEIEEQVLDTSNGYVLLRPNDPVNGDKKFLGWYTGDKKEYNFEELVTESFTLYAKWEGEELHVNQEVPEKPDYMLPIALSAASFFIVIGVVVSVIILKKGRRDEQANKKEKNE